MLNMTLEQQTEVARIVTQQPWKYLHGHVILDGDEKLHYWNPSLTGEDWQQAQALRVIVAADDIHDDECFACQIDESDILSAAIRRILNHAEARAEAAFEKLFTEPTR